MTSVRTPGSFQMDLVVRRTTACIALVAALSCRGDDSRPADGVRDRADSTPAAARTPTCNIETGTVLTGDGLGALRVGAPVEDVARSCRVLRDTTVAGAEGTAEREISVDLGLDTVRAVVSGDRVWRLHIRSSDFRTADSLGVGSPVSALRGSGARQLMGEGGVYVTVPRHCGLSFRLDGVAPGQARSLAQLPDSTRVGELLAFGCDRSGSSPARLDTRRDPHTGMWREA